MRIDAGHKLAASPAPLDGPRDPPAVDATTGILERGPELAAIAATVESVRAGSGSGLGIVGHAGTGKTRLLRAGAATACSAGLAVLWAKASPLERGFPFGVVIQLFEQDVCPELAEQRDELLAGGVVPPPEHGGPPGAVPAADGPAGNHRLLHTLCELTRAAARRRPLLLIVDDAHWIDRPSLEFITYLSGRLDGSACGVLVALRPPAAEPLDGLLSGLLEQLHPSVLELAPLSPDAIRASVEAALPGAPEILHRTCAAATGGNPRLLAELLAAADPADLPRAEDDVRRICERATSSVGRWRRARMASLPGDARRLADAIAVMGEDAPLRHAARLAGLALDEAGRSFDALAAIQILDAREPPRFAQPLIRDSIYDDISPGKRCEAHRSAARILADDGEPLSTIADQLLVAPPAGDPWVAHTLWAAGREALLDRTWRRAIDCLRRTCDEPPPKAERAAALAELGRAELAAGEDAAIEHLDAAAEQAPSDPARARVLLDLGRAYYVRGELAHARRTFDRGLDLAAGDEELEPELRAAWMTVAHLQPPARAETARRLTRYLRSVTHGQSRGERLLLAEASQALVFAGKRRELAIQLAREALADGGLLREETHHGMTWLPALASLGWSDEFGSYDEAVEVALEHAQSSGSRVGMAQALYARAFAGYLNGRLTESVSDARQAIAAVEASGARLRVLPLACAQLATALAEQGKLDEADAALAHVELDARWCDTTTHAFVLQARAHLQLHEGEPDAALATIDAIDAITSAAGIANPSVVASRSLRALAVSALGDRRRAHTLVRAELRAARSFGAPRSVGTALRVAGLIEGSEAGIALLREAVAAQARGPAPLEHARALVDLGSVMRRDGKRVEARKPLRAGLDLAHRFGAVALEQAAREELVVSGARPRRAALRGVEALTPSERRVATMASEGASNRAIAASLFVTPRTVEAHLSRSYDKLGIRSRSDLEAALSEPA